MAYIPLGISCHMTWCRLTNIVTDVGRGIGEDSVDELTDDLLVHDKMSLEERNTTLTFTPALCDSHQFYVSHTSSM